MVSSLPEYGTRQPPKPGLILPGCNDTVVLSLTVARQKYRGGLTLLPGGGESHPPWTAFGGTTPPLSACQLVTRNSKSGTAASTPPYPNAHPKEPGTNIPTCKP